MVVDAVAEPRALQVCFQCLPLLAVGLFVGSGCGGVECFEDAAYLQVVLSILVPQYVSSPEGCLLQVVYECLLLEGETLEALYFVAQHLEVCKALVGVLEVVVLCLLLAGTATGYQC